MQTYSDFLRKIRVHCPDCCVCLVKMLFYFIGTERERDTVCEWREHIELNVYIKMAVCERIVGGSWCICSFASCVVSVSRCEPSIVLYLHRVSRVYYCNVTEECLFNVPRVRMYGNCECHKQAVPKKNECLFAPGSLTHTPYVVR